MNSQQILTTVRNLLMFFAGTAAGTAAFHAIGITPDATTIGVIAGIVVGIGTYVWSFITHSEKNTVAAAATMPNVVGVTTTNTPAGRALSDAVPSEAVQVAGSPAAGSIAKGAAV